MKLKGLYIILFFLFGQILFQSCLKEEDVSLPKPSISFMEKKNYVSQNAIVVLDSVLKFNIYGVSHDEKLTNLRIWEDATLLKDTPLNTQILDYTTIWKATGKAKTTKNIKFEIKDRNGTIATVSSSIQLLYYTKSTAEVTGIKIYNAQAGSSFNSAFHFMSGQYVNATDPDSLKDILDISKTKNSWLKQYSSGSQNVRFARISQSNYENCTDTKILQEIWLSKKNALTKSIEVTGADIYYLVVTNQVSLPIDLFVFKVKSVVNDPAGEEDYIELDYKKPVL